MPSVHDDSGAPGAVPRAEEAAASGEHRARAGARARHAGRWLRARWADVAFVCLGLALVIWVGWEAFGVRLVTASPGADYWEHSATLRALLDDPFHPRNPHLDSPASSPRFVPLFVIAALLGRALGFDALDTMGLAAVGNTILFLLGIFLFFRAYFRDARASLYGLLVAFASWHEAWHYSNVYQLKIYFSVASYPSTTALGLSLLGFAASVRVLGGAIEERRGLALLSLCWALLLVTHPLTAALGFAGGVLLPLTEPGVPWPRRLRVAATVFAGILLARLWPYFSPWQVLVGGVAQEAEWAQGLGEEPSGKLHPFYRLHDLADALGLSLLAAPVILYFLIRRRHLFVALGALSMLGAFWLNAYRPLPIGHRFILLAVPYLQIALVWMLLALTRGSPQAFAWLERRYLGLAGALAVAALLGFAATTNLSKALGRFDGARRLRAAESPVVRYARAVAEIAGPRAVVLGDPRASWPVPTFGPKVVALFHLNPLVPDQYRRNAEANYFFRRASDAERAEILARYHVTHVVVKRDRERNVARFLGPLGPRRPLPGGYVIYSLRRPAS